MKRLVLLFALLVLPLSAAAEVSDMLLSSGGTLYTIESQAPSADSTSEATQHLMLTQRHGEEIRQEIVPASNARGSHLNGLLGYDSESGTLFVFWIQHFGLSLYNQLLFCTRDREGNWSAATAFGSPYNYRENLRIALSRRVVDDEGQLSNGLSVHATWWELDAQSGRESAQYWMLPIDGGKVVHPKEVDLRQFVDFYSANGPADIDGSILRHPQLASSPNQDSVTLLFADVALRSFSRVRFTPTRGIKAEGRLRVPVGRREGGFPAPRFAVTGESRMESVFGASGRTAFYTIVDDHVRYVINDSGVWSEERSIALDAQITGSAAVSALQRMVTEQ